ncbi:MAG TPA: hypothetical protein VIY28_02215 [Pseudonocardiaceae bacterium]
MWNGDGTSARIAAPLGHCAHALLDAPAPAAISAAPPTGRVQQRRHADSDPSEHRVTAQPAEPVLIAAEQRRRPCVAAPFNITALLATAAVVVALEPKFRAGPATEDPLDGDTRCAFWTAEPVDHAFDPALLIEVDLARTPSAAAAKEIPWDAVQVDDCFSGPNGAVSGTTLGPCWPELRLTGGLPGASVCGIVAAVRAPTGSAGGHERRGLRVHDDGVLARAGRFTGRKPLCGTLRGNSRRTQHAGLGGGLPAGEISGSQRSGGEHLDRFRVVATVRRRSGQPTTIGVGDAPKRGALFLISGRLSPPLLP